MTSNTQREHGSHDRSEGASNFQSRFEHGMSIMSEVVGSDASDVLGSLDSVAPDFARYMVEAGFSDVYGREGLTLQQRELLNVAVLASIGGADLHLKVHIRGALRVGVTRREVTEALFHISLYAGHPRAITAFHVARDVFDSFPESDDE